MQKSTLVGLLLLLVVPHCAFANIVCGIDYAKDFDYFADNGAKRVEWNNVTYGSSVISEIDRQGRLLGFARKNDNKKISEKAKYKWDRNRLAKIEGWTDERLTGAPSWSKEIKYGDDGNPYVIIEQSNASHKFKKTTYLRRVANQQGYTDYCLDTEEGQGFQNLFVYDMTDSPMLSDPDGVLFMNKYQILADVMRQNFFGREESANALLHGMAQFPVSQIRQAAISSRPLGPGIYVSYLQPKIERLQNETKVTRYIGGEPFETLWFDDKSNMIESVRGKNEKEQADSRVIRKFEYDDRGNWVVLEVYRMKFQGMGGTEKYAPNLLYRRERKITY